MTAGTANLHHRFIFPTLNLHEHFLRKEAVGAEF
jgi:hypothetical protein